MRDGILHEASEQAEPLFKSGRIVSLLDIVGGGWVKCDVCGRWQNVSALIEADAQEYLRGFGWTFREGKDFCPICSKADTEEPR